MRAASTFLLPGMLLPGMALGAALALAACKEDPPQVAEIRPVRVQAVTLAGERQEIAYAGTVKARIESDIGFRIGGKLVQRLVDVGARVQSGQALAKLDPQDVQLQVRSQEAQLASAEADAANAKADFDRYAKLKSGDWVSASEYDKRRTSAAVAAARVRELRSQLSVSRNSADYAVLTADAAGIVTAVLAEPGQVVSQGQAVVRVARTGEVDVVAAIPENQLGTLDGAAMTAELWSRPGERFAGSLREIAPSADPATRTYQVKVSLASPPPGLQLGMTATLHVARPAGVPVAELPLTALHQAGKDPAVWVLAASGDRVQLRPVQVGAYGQDKVTILAGLSEGEKVVTAGAHKLDANQRVRVWQEPQR